MSTGVATPRTDSINFFNKLSGRLEIQVSEAPVPLTDRLANLASPPTARLERLVLALNVFENRAFRPLTDEEWALVVLRVPSVRMRNSLVLKIVEHRAPDGENFTVRDLAAAVEETERQTRGDTQWFGGIDVHHVFFEGIRPDGEGVWCIQWGS